MRKKIFIIVFLFLIIKPIILFSAEGVGSSSSGMEVKTDAQKNKNFLEDLDSLRDPFAPQLPLPPVEEIRKPIEQPPRQIQSPSAVIPQGTVARPSIEEPLKPPAIKILGVIWNTDHPQAIINNQVFKVGDQIEGWTIQKINKDGIEMSGRGKNVLIQTGFNVPNSSPAKIGRSL